MLFAKNEKTKLALQNNWERAVSKRGYIAVVEGSVQPPTGTVKSWLKQTKTLLMYSSETKGDGKLAITNYNVVRANARYSLLEISLDTGRKNQIRVHMSDIGHPVVGDKKYGSTANPLNRLGLHAHVLSVTHPTTGELLTFESPPPAAFTNAVAAERATLAP
jgi:23S rRNA-/tRNA-specific pseudouridylate synthase